jgi:hypothetical protein
VGEVASRASLSWWLVVAGLITGCNGPGELAVKDTEGRAFTIVCTGGEACRVKRGKDGEGADAEFSLRREGRVTGVCEGVERNAYDCRPLRCEDAADCPREPGRDFTCSRRFCVDPEHPFTREDVVMLCLSGTGPGHDLARQRELYLRALESGEPPRVPPGCPSP